MRRRRRHDPNLIDRAFLGCSSSMIALVGVWYVGSKINIKRIDKKRHKGAIEKIHKYETTATARTKGKHPKKATRV
jgi:hypothetical protein